MMREIAVKAGNFRGVCPTIGRLSASCHGVYRRDREETGLSLCRFFRGLE